MKKAIVFGANGYIGASVVNKLLENKVEVLAVSRQSEYHFFQKFTERSLLTHLNLNSSEIFSLPMKIKEINWAVGESCVFYNFSWSGIEKLMDGTIENQLSNVAFISNSVKIASQLGCIKFINSGSIEETLAEVYLQNNWNSISYTLNNSNYAVSKIAARNMCKLLGYLNKIDYVHTRLSAPIDENLSGTSYIVSVFNKILNGNEYDIPINSSLFDLIDLEDVANAYYLLGHYGKNKSDYFIGSGRPQKLVDYFEFFKNRMNNRETPLRNYDHIFFNSDLLFQDTGLDLSNSFNNLVDKILTK